MINFNRCNFKLLFPTALIIILLTACGGGGVSSDSGTGGFTAGNTNTKPQISSTESSAESSMSSAATSSSAASQTQSSKLSATSSSKSSQSKSSTSSKTVSSVKSTTSGSDLTSPAAPTNFIVVSAFSDVVFLSWAKTADNVAVVAYKLYQDGIQIADIAENENYYADYNVAVNRTYTYGLSAGDAAGNWSELTTISATASTTNQTSSKASSSYTGKSSSASSISSSYASSSSSISSSKASSSSSSAQVIIGVSFQWQRPTFRENGSDLFEYEIARYELRYKLTGSTILTNVIIMSPLVSKTLIDIPSNADFEVATVDTNGMYSQFVPIRPL